VNARPAPLLPIGVLVLLVALTFWLSRFAQAPDKAGNNNPTREPDLVIENFSARKLDAAGDVQYAVNAAKMAHFPADDSSQLEKVTLIANDASESSVIVTAPLGQLVRLADGSDEVMMTGGVVVETIATNKHPAIKLTTPKLTVLPDANQARSSDGVVLKSAIGMLTARGFVLGTKTRQLVFESVDISYPPRSPK